MPPDTAGFVITPRSCLAVLLFADAVQKLVTADEQLIFADGGRAVEL